MHDLHMTNVNTTEDKRITPPPSVVVILALYRCVMRDSACERHVCGKRGVRTFACNVFLGGGFVQTNVLLSLFVFRREEQRLHLVRAADCACMKHAVILNSLS